MATEDEIRELNILIAKIDKAIVLATKTDNALKTLTQFKYSQFYKEDFNSEFGHLKQLRQELEQKKSKTINGMIYVRLDANRQIETINFSISNLQAPIEKEIINRISQISKELSYINQELKKESSLPSGIPDTLKQLKTRLQDEAQQLKSWKYTDPNSEISALKDMLSSSRLLIDNFQKDKLIIQQHKNKVFQQNQEKIRRAQYEQSIRQKIINFRQDIVDAKKFRILNSLVKTNDMLISSKIAGIQQKLETFENEFKLEVDELERLSKRGLDGEIAIEQQLSNMKTSIANYNSVQSEIQILRSSEIEKARLKVKEHISNMLSLRTLNKNLPSSIKSKSNLQDKALENFAIELEQMLNDKSNYSLQEIVELPGKLEKFEQIEKEIYLSIDQYKQDKANELAPALKQLRNSHELMNYALYALVVNKNIGESSIPRSYLKDLAVLKLKLDKFEKEIQQWKENPQDVAIDQVDRRHKYITGDLKQEVISLGSQIRDYVNECKNYTTQTLYEQMNEIEDNDYLDEQIQSQYVDEQSQSHNLTSPTSKFKDIAVEMQKDDDFELERSNVLRGNELKDLVDDELDFNAKYKKQDNINKGILQNIVNAIETVNSVDDESKMFKDKKRQRNKKRIINNVRHIATNKHIRHEEKVKLIFGLLEKYKDTVLVKKTANKSQGIFSFMSKKNITYESLYKEIYDMAKLDARDLSINFEENEHLDAYQLFEDEIRNQQQYNSKL